MKKLGIALLTAMTISAPAFAADMAARPMKAPPPPPVPVASWTGCYIGAGGGGAYSTNDHYTVDTLTVPATVLSASTTSGARGWFGTVGAGCDYQFGNWVVGAFGDYDFMSVKGDFAGTDADPPVFPAIGTLKQDWQWSVGGRVGYLAFPQLLTYVSGGFTQAHWKSTALTVFGDPAPTFILDSHKRNGWFIGTGYEYALGFLPGLYWKSEYRYNQFETADVALLTPVTLLATGFAETQKIREHSVRSQLVYRFNWGR